MPESCFSHSADKDTSLAQSLLSSPISKAQMVAPISFPAKDPMGRTITCVSGGGAPIGGSIGGSMPGGMGGMAGGL